MEFAEELKRILASACGGDYAACIADNENFCAEVERNVQETSAWENEGYYTDDDIRLAVGRVLMDKLTM